MPQEGQNGGVCPKDGQQLQLSLEPLVKKKAFTQSGLSHRAIEL